MITQLLEQLAQVYDADRHLELLTRLWQSERWFDTSRQKQASDFTAQTMRDAGLEQVQVIGFDADGKRRYQDWTTKLAWDCPDAQLQMGDVVLANRQDVPQSVVQWCGPLAAGDYPVVDFDAVDQLDPQQIRGALLLTARSPTRVKPLLRGLHPAGLISDISSRNGGDDATAWTNAWSDRPDGWHFHAADQPLTGFCLSPTAGATLRSRLAADASLRLHASCDSRLYTGQSQCVTGRLKGIEPQREIWLYGHGLETGANDNCSGVSTMIHALGLLRTLIDTGRLPRPRLSIRLIVSEECLGTLAYVTMFPELASAAVAAFNLDTCGDVSPDRPLQLNFGPLSNPSFGWPIAGVVAEHVVSRNPQFTVKCQSTVPTEDNMIADPACDVPTVQMGVGKNGTGYHSSADTPEVCQPQSLRNTCLLIGTWAYLTATLDEQLASKLMPQCAAWVDQYVRKDAHNALRNWAADRVLDDLQRWGIQPPGDKIPNPKVMSDPGGPRYRRTVFGTLTFDQLTAEPDSPLSRWHAWQASALYWMDGRRSMPLIHRLVAAEVGEDHTEAIEHMVEKMQTAGLAERM